MKYIVVCTVCALIHISIVCHGIISESDMWFHWNKWPNHSLSEVSARSRLPKWITEQMLTLFQRAKARFSGQFLFYATPLRIWLPIEFEIKTKIDRDFNTKQHFRVGLFVVVVSAVFSKWNEEAFIHINDKKWLILWSNWLWQFENSFFYFFFFSWFWHIAVLPVSKEMVHVFL